MSSAKKKDRAPAPKKGVRVGGGKRVTVAPKKAVQQAPKQVPQQPRQQRAAGGGRRGGRGGGAAMEMDVDPGPRPQRLGVARGGIRKAPAPVRPVRPSGGAGAAYGVSTGLGHRACDLRDVFVASALIVHRTALISQLLP